MNSTNSTTNSTRPVVPDICRGYENTFGTALPGLYSCGVAAYQTGQFVDGPDAFRSCCAGIGAAVAFYDNPPCKIYCNATSRAQESALYQCISKNKSSGGSTCTGHLNSDGSFTDGAERSAGTISSLLLVGLLVSMMLHA